MSTILLRSAELITPFRPAPELLVSTGEARALLTALSGWHVSKATFHRMLVSGRIRCVCAGGPWHFTRLVDPRDVAAYANRMRRSEAE